MELKDDNGRCSTNATRFQSHLYGIERCHAAAWCRRCWVSIAPLWNWKADVRLSLFRSPLCFNRTFMELKDGCRIRACTLTRVSIAPLWNWKVISNRIFRFRFCFNRTFMELKVEQGVDGSTSTASFNRTFMELKVVDMFIGYDTNGGFNRTFMELKARKS